MKTTFLNTIKTALGTLLLIFISGINLFAQKAADVQEESLWAPIVKVDGKINEWTTPLKAANRSTNLSYSMANDNKNLYLVIQSSETATNNKIMLGGITLAVNTDGKKKVKDSYNITYPIITRVRRTRIPGQGGGGGGFQQLNREQRDSMQKAQAKTQLEAAKDIKVFGFKTITDSLISVYNEYGIKASAKFDNAGIFTYELAIPLDLLNITANNPKEFAYNIKLNGLQFNGGGGDRQGGGGRPVGGGGGGRPTGGFGGSGNIDFQALMSPTDMWGKYTLTSK